MSKTFEGLSQEKKERIINASIEEFSKYGYDKASTNRLVKNLKISKGSLFQYFNSKEELYYYIIDYTVNTIAQVVIKKLGEMPNDLFERIYFTAELEFTIYAKNPLLFNLFKDAFSGKSQVSNQLISRYGGKANDMLMNILKDIKIDNKNIDVGHLLNIIKWVVKGYNDDFMEKLFSDETNVNELRDGYLEGLKRHMELIKPLVYREIQ